MRNIALRLRYDGSAYHGWQVQKKDISVAATVNAAVSKICGEKINVIGCGRTDAGVHAINYCANFRTNSTIPTDRIPLAVNTRLPSDIAVLSAAVAEDDFNAIGSCLKKEYVYKIQNSRIRDPFLQNRVCFYPAPLNYDRMILACSSFVGTHDFAAVRSVGTATKTTVRTVYSCDININEPSIEISVCANGFLYNMARAIVGTIVYAGLGKLEPSDIPELLLKKDRRLTGPTMPPQGLYLSKLWYDGVVGEMMDMPICYGI
ncbi:MAG: tRNA pseudouridine(38-40) synthase TruA [Ruminococcaceae bacterium]|nr:tRNA pseudouridine(38-40) synthase TruA [Oscillospiraceae bacterium]